MAKVRTAESAPIKRSVMDELKKYRGSQINLVVECVAYGREERHIGALEKIDDFEYIRLNVHWGSVKLPFIERNIAICRITTFDGNSLIYENRQISDKHQAATDAELHSLRAYSFGPQIAEALRMHNSTKSLKEARRPFAQVSPDESRWVRQW